MRTTLTDRRNMLLSKATLTSFPAVSAPMVIGDLHLQPLFVGEIVDQRPIFSRSSFSLCGAGNLRISFSVRSSFLYYIFSIVGVILCVILLVSFPDPFWVAQSVSFVLLSHGVGVVFSPFSINFPDMLSILVSPLLHSSVFSRPVCFVIFGYPLVLAFAARARSSIATTRFFWKLFEWFYVVTPSAFFFFFGVIHRQFSWHIKLPLFIESIWMWILIA